MSGCPTAAVYDQVQDVLGGCVKFIDWASLEPTQGAYDFQIVDNEVSKIRDLRARHPERDIGLKVRILAGASSPAWALELGGPHLTFQLCGPNATLPSCAEHKADPVPRFWSAEYGAAYARLMRAFSDHVANVPELRDVVVTRCTTIFGEPLVRTYGQSVNAKALLDAGYTAEKDAQCHAESNALFASLFPGKWVSESFSTYEIPQVSGTAYSTVDSDDQSLAFMNAFKTQLGPRAIPGNNELGRAPGPNDNHAIYAAQQQMGAPLYYQLDSLDRLKASDADKWKVYGPAVQKAASLGAAYVEIRGADYRSDIPGFLATMQPLIGSLRKNAGLK